MSLTVGSLFSGVGGFEMGFERAGFDVRWQCEIDPDATSVLERHWPNVRRYRDVREVDPADLEPVDVITFGSPCQGFSVAGTRGGLDDHRSGLFGEAIRIIRGIRPAVAVWENVPGAFSTDDGRDFGAVLAALAESGALDISWRVLDAQWFGVPQRRRRIFLVADFGGERAAQVLFESEGVRGDSPAGREARERSTPDAESGTGSSGAEGTVGSLCATGSTYDGQDAYSGLILPVAGDGVAHAVTCHQARGGDPSTDNYVVDATNGRECSGDAGTLTTELEHGNRGQMVVANAVTASAGHHGHSSPRGDGSDNLIPVAFSVRHAKRDCATVTAALMAGTGQTDNMLPAVLTGIDWQQAGDSIEDGTPTLTTTRTPADGGRPGAAVRRLTPVECERLMGWPDDHTRWRGDGREIADGPRYRMCGNGVVANVAEWIARRLRAALEAS